MKKKIKKELIRWIILINVHWHLKLLVYYNKSGGNTHNYSRVFWWLFDIDYHPDLMSLIMTLYLLGPPGPKDTQHPQKTEIRFDLSSCPNAGLEQNCSALMESQQPQRWAVWCRYSGQNCQRSRKGPNTPCLLKTYDSGDSLQPSEWFRWRHLRSALSLAIAEIKN